MALKHGFLENARDWNGWPAKVRSDGTKVQVQRSYGIPLEVKPAHMLPTHAITYAGDAFTDLIAEKSEDLEDVQVVLSGNGNGSDKFLVIQGWTTSLTKSEVTEALRVFS